MSGRSAAEQAEKRRCYRVHNETFGSVALFYASAFFRIPITACLPPNAWSISCRFEGVFSWCQRFQKPDHVFPRTTNAPTTRYDLSVRVKKIRGLI